MPVYFSCLFSYHISSRCDSGIDVESTQKSTVLQNGSVMDDFVSTNELLEQKTNDASTAVTNQNGMTIDPINIVPHKIGIDSTTIKFASPVHEMEQDTDPQVKNSQSNSYEYDTFIVTEVNSNY